jgi:hypothetical protein
MALRPINDCLSISTIQAENEAGSSERGRGDRLIGDQRASSKSRLRRGFRAVFPVWFPLRALIVSHASLPYAPHRDLDAAPFSTLFTIARGWLMLISSTSIAELVFRDL